MEMKSSMTPTGSSRSTSGAPRGPKGCDHMRMIGTPTGAAGLSTVKGARSRNRLRYSSPSRITARRTSRSSRRSEEHTSELQSRENLVCRLLLEIKKKKIDDVVDV